MTEQIRLWEVKGDKLASIKPARLDLEKNLQTWLEKDISILSNNLLVIGKEVMTSFGGEIDLLCLDNNGYIVILELKRDKTPREIVAQALDYASWVKDLSTDEIVDIGNAYLGDGAPLKSAFAAQFGQSLPEVLNEGHEILVVAAEIDSNSERIIKYLSESYDVPINAATFQFFKDEQGKEYLARVFLIEPEEVEVKTQAENKQRKRVKLTEEGYWDKVRQRAPDKHEALQNLFNEFRNKEGILITPNEGSLSIRLRVHGKPSPSLFFVYSDGNLQVWPQVLTDWLVSSGGIDRSIGEGYEKELRTILTASSPGWLYKSIEELDIEKFKTAVQGVITSINRATQ
jgi:hypothetical protein